VPQGWSGSVTPSLAGYSFTPGARSHSNVTASLSAQDFAAAVDTGTAAIYYIHTDHLGTPRVITNQPAQVLWRWDQVDPFGANAANENPSGLGTFTNNLRLPGQYFDKETNLHYNYFRDYDPAIGRYVQSDPIGLEGGVNTYAYVEGNPLRFTDPLGLFITTVQATCFVNPQFCAEIVGQIIENTSQITEGCVTDEASAAASAIRSIGTLAAIATIAVSGNSVSSTLSLLKTAVKTPRGAFKVDPATLNQIGTAEARRGKGFSGLAPTIEQSKPATFGGQLTGGTQTVVSYADPVTGKTKFVVHTVTDRRGFVVHRDFDAVRIESGQFVVK
jgi:RHS repeat-associated protein